MREAATRYVLVVAALVHVLLPRVAGAFDLSGTLWERHASRYGLDPYLLYAVALVESGHYVGSGQARPWPWTLGTPERSYFFDTRAQAERKLADLLAAGKTNIGVGLGQINIRHHGRRVDDPTELFNPETNVALVAQILFDAMRRHPGDPIAGIGAYYSSRPHYARPYARKVLRIANLLHQLHARGGNHVAAR